MTTFAGSSWFVMVCLFLILLTSEALARVTTEVDRNDMALGETLRLTITADAGERPDQIDLSGIDRDFDILQRSSATSARVISGEQNVTRTLELELSPKRDGLLTIPAMSYNGRRTTPIAIKVDPQPNFDSGDELVQFDAEIDQQEVYVQAQVILTVTLQQAINLDNRAVSELNIPNTYIEQLEQKSFQRRIGGRLWQVTELRYALFPQQSGTLEIPPITFSGRELLPGRSLLGARLGRRIALKTDSFSIAVRPPPAAFPGDVWLPARSLTLTDKWSKTPDKLAVGDSTTRSIELTAEGLQGSQLPPVSSLGDEGNLQGLRFYPDKETIQQRELSSGLEGYRLQSEALVATESGSWDLPELVVPWWNVETDTLEYARIPGSQVIVGSGASTRNVQPGDLAVAPTSASSAGTQNAPSTVLIWQVAAGIGWLLSLLLAAVIWRNRGQSRGPDSRSSNADRQLSISNRELVPLRLACSENNPRSARQALQVWGQVIVGSSEPPTLTQLAADVGGELAAEVHRLDRALYSGDGSDWQGDRLFALVRDYRPASSENQDSELSLYPV